jgi:hypothetical protein
MPKFTKQEIKPLKPEDCVIFDKCSAPICPLYNKGVWFSDEDICTNEYFQQTRQVKNQKKLKKNKSKGVFTIEILGNLKRIGKKTKGLSN